uniref:Uncharacterized protein n=1 Tax=Pararge aegeria TaxID=116150 RepID=S4PFT5_9NEOP
MSVYFVDLINGRFTLLHSRTLLVRTRDFQSFPYNNFFIIILSATSLSRPLLVKCLYVKMGRQRLKCSLR